MEILPDSVAAYKRDHGRKLMVLTTPKNATLGNNDFCRIRSVETLSPGLWITATFLDGSIQRFRPEKIRLATPDEERLAGGIDGENAGRECKFEAASLRGPPRFIDRYSACGRFTPKSCSLMCCKRS